jgi:hypothetical protein
MTTYQVQINDELPLGKSIIALLKSASEAVTFRKITAKTAILAGAKINKATSLNIKRTAKKEDFFAQPVKKQYEYFFGKKKEYSEKDVIVFNSILNVSKILAKEDEN